MVKFVPGKEYTQLCDKCRKVIDEIWEVFNMGVMEDTDDEEAPCNYVYDNALFCGGHECINTPETS